MFAFFARALGWLGVQEVLKFTAQKIVLVAVITLVFMPLLWNLLLEILITIVDFGLDRLDQVAGNTAAPAVALAGLAGWMVNALKIPEIVSLICSFMILKVTLRMIGSLIPGLKTVN